MRFAQGGYEHLSQWDTGKVPELVVPLGFIYYEYSHAVCTFSPLTPRQRTNVLLDVYGELNGAQYTSNTCMYVYMYTRPGPSVQLTDG